MKSPMSKKFKGMQCAYCLDAVATTVDHVFSREFFLVEDRGYLPEAPACKACNDEKSRMEHYLTAVLPFGGRHDPGARESRRPRTTAAGEEPSPESAASWVYKTGMDTAGRRNLPAHERC